MTQQHWRNDKESREKRRENGEKRGDASSGAGEGDGVRIVRRDDVMQSDGAQNREEIEIDLRTGAEQKVVRRSPWRERLAETIENEDILPFSHRRLQPSDTVPTPFLRPLQHASLDDEFDEIDLTDTGRYGSEVHGVEVHDVPSSSSSPLPASWERGASSTVRIATRTARASVSSHGAQENVQESVQRSGVSDTSMNETHEEDAVASSTSGASHMSSAANATDASPAFAVANDVKEESQKEMQKESWIGARISPHTKTTTLGVRILTGVLAAAVAAGAFALGPLAVAIFATLCILGAAAEYYGAVRQAGHRPATALGLFCIGGMLLGTYISGFIALPLMLVMSIAFAFFWYITGVAKSAPLTNIAITMLGVLWIGVFGSFATLILRAPHRLGLAVLLGTCILVAANDTGAYFGGRHFGRRLFAPEISPSKTWEGFAAGAAATLCVAIAILPFVHPWSLGSAAAVACFVAAIAPLGDLAESLIKRDLGIKDMGSVLPGHGGVLDRIDGLLFALPLVYFAAVLMHLV